MEENKSTCTCHFRLGMCNACLEEAKQKVFVAERSDPAPTIKINNEPSKCICHGIAGYTCEACLHEAGKYHNINEHHNYVAETLSKLCEHKNYQIDENRKISRRVDELDNSLSKHYKNVADLISNISISYTEKINSVSRRIDELVGGMNDYVCETNKKIDQLQDENLKLRSFYDCLSRHVNEHICKEDNIHEKCLKIADNCASHYQYLRDEDKKPRKCPVCEGLGEIIENYQTIFGAGGIVNENNVRVTCHSCEGTGIIWG